MNTLFLGIGSNLGNRITTINKCLKLLKKHGKVLDSSFMYETSPLIVTDQPRFLNAVLKYETHLSPFDALNFFECIERDLGCPKPKPINKGPRTIDIDILFYNDLIMNEVNLAIPHPAISERDFVLTPMADIDHEYIHPIEKKSIKELLEVLGKNSSAVLSAPRRVLAIENKALKKSKGEFTFDLESKTLKMGIVNLTPDSLTDPLYSKLYEGSDSKSQAQKKIASLLAQKLTSFDLLDIGGESTRPGAKSIEIFEEYRRVVPVLEEFSKLNESQDSLLSLDTNKLELAKFGLNNGVSLINEISSVNSDEMLKLLAEELCPVILMHNRGSIDTHMMFAEYEDFKQEYVYEMNQKIARAKQFGIPRWNIMTSPGFGFAKKPHHNIELIKNLDKFKLSTGDHPLVAGFSNKGFVRKQFGDNIFLGNALYTTMSIQKGANVIRYHDPKLSSIIDHIDEVYKRK